jgi:hypothetical protein
MAAKVVIENAILRGSQHGSPLDKHSQRIATVYFEGGEEFNVMAPSRATGDALEWLNHVEVRRQGTGGYTPVTDHRHGSIINQVMEALRRLKRDANRPEGRNPDGLYYDAQICMRGHVQSSGGFPFEGGEHCNKCGEMCIDECLRCKTPIRGQVADSRFMGYDCPAFCHACGRPYPWMEDRLQTAKELLDHDDKLTLEDREKLWGLLQYVMSDPKSDMAPAKKKIIEFDLKKAAAATRDIVTDLLAKYAAEMSKP